jgi:hypothetical protein
MYFLTNWEIQLSFVKISEFREGEGVEPPNPPRYATGSSLTLTTGRMEWLDSRSGRFYLEEKAPNTEGAGG